MGMQGLGTGDGRGGQDKRGWCHHPANALSAHRFSQLPPLRVWSCEFCGFPSQCWEYRRCHLVFDYVSIPEACLCRQTEMTALKSALGAFARHLAIVGCEDFSSAWARVRKPSVEASVARVVRLCARCSFNAA